VADLEGLRPTSDRLRETLFNWLAADVPGARCLDLFAGTGALGLEALSRGARHCDFVETQAAAQNQLRANIEALGCGDRATLWAGSAFDIIPRLSDPFDLVFIDPPFADALHARAVRALLETGLLSAGSLVYLEYARDRDAGLGSALGAVREKTIGAVSCSLARVL
jgi:16S rRNA (guanine966-N2)-methyltransferase